MHFTSPCSRSSSYSQLEKESPESHLPFKENGLCNSETFYKVVNSTVFAEKTNTSSRGKRGMNGPVINCPETLQSINTLTPEKSFSQLLDRVNADLDMSTKHHRAI